MKCLLCKDEGAWSMGNMNEKRDHVERLACGKCGVIFERMAYHDRVGDDLAKVVTRAVNSVMFYTRLAKWTIANLGKSYSLVERAFQESAIEGLCSKWKFEADVKKRASGEMLPDGVVVNSAPVNGAN